MCGTQVSDEDVFCESCGRRLSSETTSDADPARRSSQSSATTARMRNGIRPVDGGKDALLGLYLAAGIAAATMALIYLLLFLYALFGSQEIPYSLGLVLYALLHGGAAALEVPPTEELLGIGGSLRLGLPISSFALLPFLAFLFGARTLGRRARSPLPFAVGAILPYAVIVSVLALLGGASIEGGQQANLTLAATPFSAGLWSLLWAALGVTLGVAAFRGPLLPSMVRQIAWGGVWAVGISAALAVLIAIILAVIQQATGAEGTGVAVQQRPEDFGQSVTSTGTGIQGVLGLVGVFFTLLPLALGTLWLLSNGLPIGLQNISDLSQIPLVGPELADLTLRASLLGSWPFWWGWRLLLIAPIVGLILGGMAAARGTPDNEGWWRGALVAIPYTTISLLVALMVGVTANLTIMGGEIDVAFMASLPWLLLLLPVGALLGGVGGFLGGEKAFLQAPRPSRAFLTAAVASSIILVGSLPILAAPLVSPGGGFSELGQDTPVPGQSTPPSTTPGFTQESSPEVTQSEQETTEPNLDIESSNVSPEESPDPAFDELLPVLQETTTAPIMLPAELPQELQNVAIDVNSSGEEYGILFLGEPTGNVVETFLGANNIGTLMVSTEPTDRTEFFEATSTEAVELPDGTEATLRYMEPIGDGGNQGPFWEGQFERDGYFYDLTILLPDPTEEIAGSVLSSMVEVDEGTSAEIAPEEILMLQYENINARNYEAAYDLFAEQSKQIVSLDEYTAFFENAGYYELTDYSFPSAQVEGDAATVAVDFDISSGTGPDEQYQVTQQMVREDGSWRVVMRDAQVETFTGT